MTIFEFRDAVESAVPIWPTLAIGFVLIAVAFVVGKWSDK
jgi:hypothetical protein